MTGQRRERDTCRFDISSPIWALPDKAWKGCGKGVCSDQRRLIRFPPSKQAYASLLLLFFRRDWPVHEKLTLVFPRACVSLHFHRSPFLFLLVRRRILGGLVAFICLSIKQDIDFSTISPFIFVCLFYPCEILYISYVYIEFYEIFIIHIF